MKNEWLVKHKKADKPCTAKDIYLSSKGLACANCGATEEDEMEMI